MFGKFHITFASAVAAAALGMLALPVAPSPASASICGDVIFTAWTVVGDANTTSGTSFTACSTMSTVAGDGALILGDRDPYSFTVKAIDGDTFQVLGSVQDFGPPDPIGVLVGGFSPEVTLVLSGIDWVGMSGTITNAFKTSVGPCTAPCSGVLLNVIAFTTDSVTLGGAFFGDAFGGGALACLGNCSLTNINMGTFDITAVHVPIDDDLSPLTAVPLPAALPLFLSALAGLGLMGWRRRQAGV